MARKSINEIKQLAICKVLADNNWDYTIQNKTEQVYEKCIMEMMTWFSRRGTRLLESTLVNVLENICQKEQLDTFSKANVIMAATNFAHSYLYKQFQEPLVKNISLVNLKKGNVLEYNIPVLEKTDAGTLYAMIINPSYRTDVDLAMSYEAKFISVWSFYSANRYANIYNIYIDEGKTKTVKLRCTQEYILKAKKQLLELDSLFYNKGNVAPSEVCMGCDWRNKCPMNV